MRARRRPGLNVKSVMTGCIEDRNRKERVKCHVLVVNTCSALPWRW